MASKNSPACCRGENIVSSYNNKKEPIDNLYVPVRVYMEVINGLQLLYLGVNI